MPALLAASLLWAFSFGLIKGELSAVSPLAVAAGRLTLAACIFLPIAGRGVRGARLRWSAAGLGVIQFGLMYVLYIASFRWLAAWVVALFTILTPVYVVLMAEAGRRRFGAGSLSAALLAVAGAALVTVRGVPADGSWVGILLLQGANICFAAGQLAYGPLKRRSGAADSALLAWMYAGAAAATVLAAAVSGAVGTSPWAGWDRRSLLVLLYLGALPTALGFYLWNRGAARTAPGVLAAANNLKVPLAVLVSWLVFGEGAAEPRALAGMALLVAALVLADRTGGRAPA